MWSDVALLLAGGALATAGSVVSIVLTARYERRSRHDERLWTRRADVYVALSEVTPGSSGWNEISAGVKAFASARVRQLVVELDWALDELQEYVEENYPELLHDPILRETVTYDGVARKEGKVAECRERLVTQIRSELGSDGHGAP